VEQSSELTEAMSRYFGALATGDVGALEELLSDDQGLLVLGTDPDEWWGGRETIVRTFARQMEEAGGSFPVVAEQITAYSEGGFGWAASKATFTAPDGTRAPIRVSAVFRREGGQWRIIHAHNSVGVTNEDLVGRELTIEVSKEA